MSSPLRRDSNIVLTSCVWLCAHMPGVVVKLVHLGHCNPACDPEPGAEAAWSAEQVVEEFMSIADGQTVLRAGGGEAGSGGVSVDPRLSVSRIGSRAFPPALEVLAPQIRHVC